jgi:hypothetical protein
LAKAEAKNQKDRWQLISAHRYSFDGNALNRLFQPKADYKSALQLTAMRSGAVAQTGSLLFRRLAVGLPRY